MTNKTAIEYLTRLIASADDAREAFRQNDSTIARHNIKKLKQMMRHVAEYVPRMSRADYYAPMDFSKPFKLKKLTCRQVDPKQGNRSPVFYDGILLGKIIVDHDGEFLVEPEPGRFNPLVLGYTICDYDFAAVKEKIVAKCQSAWHNRGAKA